MTQHTFRKTIFKTQRQYCLFVYTSTYMYIIGPHTRNLCVKKRLFFSVLVTPEGFLFTHCSPYFVFDPLYDEGTLSKLYCFVSALSVHCQCVASLFPVSCQSIGRLLPDLTTDWQ